MSWGSQQIPLEFLLSECHQICFALGVHLPWASKNQPHLRDEVTMGHKEDPQLMGPLIGHLRFMHPSGD